MTSNNSESKPGGERLLHIAIGASRQALLWENKAVTWEEFLSRCRTPIVTRETKAEYAAMSRDDRGKAKDVGGFVGGYLLGGQRKKSNVTCLSLATLDIDEGTPDTWDIIRKAVPYAALLYSTHSYTPDNPRYRLIIPFTRDISPSEYAPVCRRITAKIDAAAGKRLFDETTYAVGRLFYWPSVSKDATLVYEVQDGPFCDPDDLKHEPLNAAEQAIVDTTIPEVFYNGTLEDPRKKRGIIGAFCTVYSVQQAIAEFLPTTYLPTRDPRRYTLAEGSTQGGLIIYDNLFAYSFHAHDIAAKHCYNAYDLVRVHLFGTDKVRSEKKMNDLALSDSKVKALVIEQQLKSAKDDFNDIINTTSSNADKAGRNTATAKVGKSTWQEELEVDKRGRIISSARNIQLILEKADEFKNKFWYNAFSGEYVAEGILPWSRNKSTVTDADMSNLRVYLENKFGITGKDKIYDVFVAVCTKHRRNPVQDYFNSLQWDGVSRLDKLIIDYIGAEDLPLYRAMTRKHFTAAVARVFEPGCKYDYCLILIGKEGIGKSTLFDVMGGDYYTDSVRSLDGKDAEEILKQKVVVELSELSAIKRNTVEDIKSFISRRVADIRAPYGRITEKVPRHVIFCGTTNEELFLKGDTGNRRFWCIKCDEAKRKNNNIREALLRDRDQLWAEAVYRYKTGEELYLSEDMETEARQWQAKLNDDNDDPVLAALNEYLDIKLPSDWENYDLPARKIWIAGRRNGSNLVQGDEERQTFCVREFMEEALGMPITDKSYKSTARKVGRWMSNMPGWERSEQNIIRTKNYGRQKYWINSKAKILKHDKDDDL